MLQVSDLLEVLLVLHLLAFCVAEVLAFAGKRVVVLLVPGLEDVVDEAGAQVLGRVCVVELDEGLQLLEPFLVGGIVMSELADFAVDVAELVLETAKLGRPDIFVVVELGAHVVDALSHQVKLLLLGALVGLLPGFLGLGFFIRLFAFFVDFFSDQFQQVLPLDATHWDVVGDDLRDFRLTFCFVILFTAFSGLVRLLASGTIYCNVFGPVRVIFLNLRLLRAKSLFCLLHLVVSGGFHSLNRPARALTGARIVVSAFI